MVLAFGMLVVFDEGAGVAGNFRFYDQSYEHSYDWSNGGGRSGVGPAPMVRCGEAGDPGGSVPAGGRVCDVIARREVSSSLIYTWRKQLREGKLAGAMPSLPVFAAVQVAELTPPAPQPLPCASGLIQIELPGGVRVSVDASVDAGALARVLSVLR